MDANCTFSASHVLLQSPFLRLLVATTWKTLLLFASVILMAHSTKEIMKTGPCTKLTVMHPHVLHQYLKACNRMVTAVAPQAVERLSPCLAASPRVSSHHLLAIPSISVTSRVAARDMQTSKASATLPTVQKVSSPCLWLAVQGWCCRLHNKGSCKHHPFQGVLSVLSYSLLHCHACCCLSNMWLC